MNAQFNQDARSSHRASWRTKLDSWPSSPVSGIPASQSQPVTLATISPTLFWHLEQAQGPAEPLHVLQSPALTQVQAFPTVEADAFATPVASKKMAVKSPPAVMPVVLEWGCPVDRLLAK